MVGSLLHSLLEDLDSEQMSINMLGNVPFVHVSEMRMRLAEGLQI